MLVSPEEVKFAYEVTTTINLKLNINNNESINIYKKMIEYHSRVI